MFEVHITIEPVEGAQLQLAEHLAKAYSYKVAELMMVKRLADTPERSKYDTFMTGHRKTMQEASQSMRDLIRELKSLDFKIWRYKIEEIRVDSKYQDDPWGLL